MLENFPCEARNGLNAARRFPTDYSDPMGPTPETSVMVLMDLGLSGSEIAEYFRVPESDVTTALRKGVRTQRQSMLQAFAQSVRGRLLSNLLGDGRPYHGGS